MADPVTLTLIALTAAGVATGGTKTGRAATRNAVRAGYKATGWRGPRTAVAHHAGRAGALAGRATGKTARAARQLTERAARATRRLAAAGVRAGAAGAVRAARAGNGRLADRWHRRAERGDAAPRPPIRWPARKPTGPDVTPGGPDASAVAAPDAAARQTGRQADVDRYRVSALPDGHPDQRHYAMTVQRRGDNSWAVCRDGFVLNRDKQWEPEPSVSNRDAEFLARTRYSRDDALAAATREAPRITVNDRTPADVLARDRNSAARDPQTGPAPGAPNTDAAASGAGQPVTAPPDTAPGSTAPPSPLDARQRAERSTTVRNRYTINLEMPSSDGEFLESCIMLGDVLRAIAEEISEWAGDLHALNLPSSVIQPLDSISEGLSEAAGGTAQAAKAFEDEFEDAREVASRGMTITGQDAA